MNSSNLILYIIFIALLVLICILYYIFDTKIRLKIITKRKKIKKLNKLRERIEFYGFLTDICRDVANRHTMNKSNYIKRSEFFCDLEHKAIEEYNKLNGEK